MNSFLSMKGYTIFDHAQLGHTPHVNKELRRVMTTHRTPDDKLRDTWQRERGWRPHWPPTFEQCIAEPLIRSVLEILHNKVPAITRKEHAPRQRELQAIPEPQAPALGFRHTPPAPTPQPHNYRDSKSAAANDKDD